ncbi:MAG: hypothetical protein KA436_00675 [Oligoflexales bacterium]|nr:hypothetical protein [Oligoflexales bacterium]
MGVLRFVKKSERIHYDNKSAFEIDMRENAIRRPSPSPILNYNHQSLRLKKIFFYLICLMSLGLTMWALKKHYFKPQNRQVYFEIKAIDEEGHPVAGAHVFHHTQNVGVTDAFGEWRKSMNVSPEGGAVFFLEKKSGSNTWQASKNISIPSADSYMMSAVSKPRELKVNTYVKLMKKI